MATTFYATGGADAFQGGAGETTVSYEGAPGGVQVFLSGGGSPSGWALGDTYVSVENAIGTGFNDYISGNGQNNYLYGRAGDDSLYGFAQAGSTTHLFGEAGLDTLIGGAGIDVMDGGADEDTVSYLLSSSGLTISLADSSANTGWATGDVYISIQDVIGSEFGDTIYGSHEGVLNQLQGQGGADRIFGGTGYNVLIGGAGADQLNGRGTGNLIDYETATAGVTASMLNPSINAGDAAGDTYVALSGADLAGSPFDDILQGDDGNNNIVGDPSLAVYGRFGNDMIYGAGGNDVIQGDGGADFIDGGSGYDVASYDSSSIGITVSMLDAAASTGDAKGDTFANVEGLLLTRFNDIVIGNSQNNVIQGMAGNDTIYGAGGSDLLVGNEGDDVIVAGPGTSRLEGGSGADTFRFVSIHDSVSTPTIAPTIISDFQTGVDKIDVSSLSPTNVSIVQESGFYTLQATNGEGTLSVRSVNAFGLADVTTTKAPGSPPAGFESLGSHGGAEWRIGDVGDFNGDGTADVFWRNANTGQVDQWQIKNGSWAQSIDYGSRGPAWSIEGVGDFNGDGTDDVFWRNANTGQVDQWQLKGGYWAQSIDYGSRGAEWKIEGVGDFNGDGTEDAFWRNANTGQVDQWQLKGGYWEKSTDFGSRGADWSISGVGDFNGDGTDDVLWHNRATGQTDEWQMKNGQWQASIDHGTQDTRFVLVGTADFDANGVDEAVWYNSTSGELFSREYDVSLV